MTSRIPAHRRVRIVAATTLGVALFAAACEMTPRGSSPSPTEPDLANVMEPEAEGVSEQVVIRMMVDDTTAGREVSGTISPEGDVTIVRVGTEGDTTEIRGMKIRMSPLADLERDGAKPLYIVDGERVQSIEGLDPSRIVTIDVLKGPTAVERFGAGAEDGVVQIRTGEPGVQVRRPLPESSGSAQREDVLEIARDGVGLHLERREPGESRVRVFNSQNPEAQPLIIVDGKRGVSIEELDPARIETIEVIKDPDAAAQYGPEAKDGVILVTTRKVGEVSRSMENVTREVETITAAAAAATARVPREVEVPRQVEAARTVNVARIATIAEAATANAEPLIIVEGEVIPSRAALSDRFPPETIESISVLKDASATAIYGERGRNGVIIVELKD